MRFSPSLMRVVVALCLLAATQLPAQTIQRLSGAKGAEARTLVIYSETHAAYSLANDLTALKLLLSRVAGQQETIPAAQADAAKVNAADYVVVFCPQPFPKLDKGLLEVLAQTEKPVLWVGYGSDQLAKLTPLKGGLNISPYASEKIVDKVIYGGRELSQPLPVWLPVQVVDTNVPIVVSLSAITVSMNETNSHPVGFKSGHLTFYTALPTSTAAAPVFGDMLLDFYGVANPPGNLICVRIDGYHARQDHLEFRHLVEYLRDHAIPFIVGVVPAYFDPESKAKELSKKILDLDTQPEYVSALRFAQANGGRLILQGYVNTRKSGTGREPELWDVSLDRPYGDDSAEDVRFRINQGLRQMLRHGLFPLGWETPFYAASRADYAEIAAHFSTCVERIQLSEATWQENFAAPSVGVDEFGRTIIPENLGVVTGQRAAYTKIQQRAELLAQLRGTVGICSFPAYMDDGKLAQTLGAIKSAKPLYLDLADSDNWVQSSDTVLLTGNATRTRTLNKATITHKVYDRSGKLLSSEVEPQPASGERVFKRGGQGDIDIFEILEATPSAQP